MAPIVSATAFFAPRRARRGSAPGRGVAIVGAARASAAACSRCASSRARRPTRSSGGARDAQGHERYHQRFGDDAVVVLVRGAAPAARADLRPRAAARARGLPRGNVPATATAAGRGPRRRARSWRADQAGRRSSTAPARSSTSRSARSTASSTRQHQPRRPSAQARLRAATRSSPRRRAGARAEQKRLADAGRASSSRPRLRARRCCAWRSATGSARLPPIDNPDFVSSAGLRPRARGDRPEGPLRLPVPQPELGADPGPTASPDLSDAQRRRAIDQIRAAARMPGVRLTQGERYTVTGAPVVVTDLANEHHRLDRSCCFLARAARDGRRRCCWCSAAARLRLLPLAVALGAAGVTFGGDGARGRVADDGLDRGAAGADRPRPSTTRSSSSPATTRSSRRRAPSRGEAAQRAAAAGRADDRHRRRGDRRGFLVLLLSPVPMVRGFGLLLVIGIALAFVLRADGRVRGARARRPPPRLARRRTVLRRAGAVAGSAWRGAGDLAARGPARAPPRASAGPRAPGRAPERWRSSVPRIPRASCSWASRSRCAGWVAPTRRRRSCPTSRKLVPHDLPALRDLTRSRVHRSLGGDRRDGRGRRPHRPEGRALDARLPGRPCSSASATASRAAAARAELCPALSLPDLFTTAADGALAGAHPRSCWTRVPPYFSRR